MSLTSPGIKSTIAATAGHRAIPQVNRARPVLWWAAIGAAFMLLTVYAWSDWYLSGHAVPTPTGPTPVPEFQRIAARCWEILFTGFALFAIYHFIYKAWRQARGLTTDGMLLIAWYTLWLLQDPWLSYTQNWFSYNAVFVNFGCPQCHIPGWQATGVKENLPEPILFMGGMYIGVLFPATVLTCYLMRGAKQRWPQIGTAELIGFAIGSMAIADTIAELIWLRMGLYSYTGAIRSLSVFGGHAYQFPLYQAVLWGGVMGAASCVRYFVDDKGLTVAERGIDRVQGGVRKKALVRLLAIIGIIQSIMFVYNVIFQWFGTHADPFPQEILDRSYMTAGMCGPGTNTACPGPQVPIPVGPNSARLTPEGQLFAPIGVPTQIRNREAQTLHD